MKRLFLLLFCVVTLPLSAQNTLRILPLGNSITRGSMCLSGDIHSTCQDIGDANAIGYRLRLQTLLEGEGYSVDYIGKEKSGYSIMEDIDHSGFGGIRDHQLADIMETGTSSWGTVTAGPYMNSYGAEVVLLHIGTNDILGNDYTSAADVNRILEAIDDYEDASGEPVLVFLAQIISIRNAPCNTDFKTKTFNSRIYSLAQSRISSGDNLVLVDMECDAGLNYYEDMMDQVHPNQDGYDKMADLWFQYINAYNTAPNLNAIPSQTVDRGQTFTSISLDSYASDVEDPDAALNWSLVPANPEHFNVSIVNRVATVTPKDPQWSGSESITFVVTDNGRVVEGLAKSASSMVDFTVEWIPEISGQVPLFAVEDQSINLSLNHLSIVEEEKAPGPIELLVLSGSNYTVNGLTVTPAADYNGSLSVPLKIRVNGMESEIYNLAIDVSAVNDNPVITGQAEDLVTKQDSCLDLPLTAFEVEDVDNNYPADFTLEILPGANYTYTDNTLCPAASYYGFLPVHVKVFDGQGRSESFTATVEVLSVNPVFILPETLSVLEDELYQEGVALSHFNPEAFTFSALELPAWMSFNPATRVLSGIPENADVGLNPVRLRVSDGEVSADTLFNVEVLNVPDPPVFISSPLTVAFTDQEYSYSFEVSDPDPDAQLVYTLEEKPYWLQLNPATRKVYGTPGASEEGTHQVRIQVDDGDYQVVQSYELEVIYQNAAPEILTVPGETARVYSTYTYGLQAIDNNNDPLEYFAPLVPPWLQFYPSTQVLIGAPSFDDLGMHTVVLAVSDGIDTTLQSFNVTVKHPVSTGGALTAEAFTLYPNPVDAKLNIQWEARTTAPACRFELYDMNGKLLLHQVLEDRSTQLDFRGRGFTDGLYFFRIKADEGQEVLQEGKLILLLKER